MQMQELKNGDVYLLKDTPVYPLAVLHQTQFTLIFCGQESFTLYQFSPTYTYAK